MFNRVFSLLGCILLLFLSWTAVLGMQEPAEKQAKLIASAREEMDKGTYANAEPDLTDAIKYNTRETMNAWEDLKEVYLQLGDTSAYVKALKNQTSRADCPVEVYREFADYYITQDKLFDALQVLKTGIERTKDESLVAFYEEQRYAFTYGRETYDDVTAYQNGGIQVKGDGLWGLADSFGAMVIPMAYTQITAVDTANRGCVVAMQPDRRIVTLNHKNQPIAILDANLRQAGTPPPMEINVVNLGRLSQNIVSLQLAGGKWILADSLLNPIYTLYDGAGAASNAAIALQIDGSWGVTALNGKEILPFEYDGIIMDELGRCYAQKAVFAKKGGVVGLFVDGKLLLETYDDARPFTDDGWAAVKKNGKWGFVDTSGKVVVDYQFEDALSFTQHLAAVKQGGLWGYIGLNGKIAIKPEFRQAKSFAVGSAPVLTEGGWKFITLVEYKKGSGL